MSSQHKPDAKFVPIDPGVRIGHVHLKVADLERALNFYCGVLGFELTQRYGHEAAFVSAGGYHHHIGLNTWESKGGVPPPVGTTGLYHVAILYPTRAALVDAMRRLTLAGIRLDGASDHGVSEAVYLRDPDNNGVELYWDRPHNAWPRNADGSVNMYTRPLAVDELLASAVASDSYHENRLRCIATMASKFCRSIGINPIEPRSCRCCGIKVCQINRIELWWRGLARKTRLTASAGSSRYSCRQ
jgi:catechol 2,3-dioxygenase